MRTRILSLALSAAAACTFSEEKVGLKILIDDVPAQADHLDVTFTDSLNHDAGYRPSFQPNALDGGPLELDLAAPQQVGNYTVSVVAGIGGSQLGVPAGRTAVFDGGIGGFEIDLRFATPCNLDGGCGTGSAACKMYGGDVGVCTAGCSAPADCQLATPSPSCLPFPASDAGFCQWECTATPSACPLGLSCKAAAGGKSYCTGI